MRNADRAHLVHTLGETIAARRYEAWDEHSRDLTWPEYKRYDPNVAHGIYLEDGHDDARALLPIVEQLVENASRVAAALALRGAAGRFTELSPDARELLVALADAYESASEGGADV